MLARHGLLLCVGRALDALTLGEDAAGSLGIDLTRTRLAIVAGTALSVGAATAVTGIIGFVGLLVPHSLRPFAGHRPACCCRPACSAAPSCCSWPTSRCA